MVSDALQVELPLIQDQLQDLSQHLSELQKNTWSSEGDTSAHLDICQSHLVSVLWTSYLSS